MKALADYRRIVVKIGSALLVDPQSGIRREWLGSLIDDIASLNGNDVQIILVSSGAIAIGRHVLGLGKKPLKLEENQAAAAAGQIALAQAFTETLSRVGLKAGQVLLTIDDTEQRRRYLNARATINTLVKLGAVPVINENDTVATSEIRYGDNDRLAARVATMIGADLLILLSDIDGLYSAPPQKDANAAHIPFVERIDASVEAIAGPSGSAVGSGGMRTKIDAGKIATSAGTAMIIASGHHHNPLSAIANGTRHTLFHAEAKPVKSYKTWISGTLEPAGSLTIDAGAARALANGKSLLAAGVIQITGEFSRGDTVAILDVNDREIARGLIAYDASDAQKIIGCQSAQIADILGYAPRAAVVHRDDMVVAQLEER